MDSLEEYWTQRNKEFFEEARYSTWTFKQLVDKSFDVKGKKTIDLGCGYGMMLGHLQQSGAIVDGLEICSEVVEICEKNDNLNVIQGDCRNIPLKDNSYDYVMSFGVIEHFPEWKESIKEHFRVCKPGGRVLIAVPYLWSPLYYLMCLFYTKRIMKYGRIITAGKPFTKKNFMKRWKNMEQFSRRKHLILYVF